MPAEGTKKSKQNIWNQNLRIEKQKMSEEFDSKGVSDFLTAAGCCQICVLRFLKPNIDDFLDEKFSVQKVNKRFEFRMIY